MIYQGKPCLPYFSSVVKNVANPNIEVKKLVYIYLLHYAESDPDLALLSVNAIQKSLTDQNPQVRALALRTMSGMQVPVISQIVSLAIKRGVGDMSPQVRKAAALAIPKCYRLDPNTLPQLLEYLSTLLGDKQYFVAGPAVMAFLAICPDRIDLIHKHYRSLVKMLVDMDEWSQLATLRLMLHYCRRCFPRRIQKPTMVTKQGFYDDEPTEKLETAPNVMLSDPDLDLFLKSCQPLLSSRNSAVVIAVTSCIQHLSTPSHLEATIGPMISLLRGSPAVRETALYNIVSIALDHPSLLLPHASHFFLKHTDTSDTWHLKIELLTLLFPHSALHLKSLILSEFEHFAHDTSSIQVVRETVRAIGRCAQSDPSTSSRCFHILLNQITSFDNTLVSEVLTVIRHLIQQDPTAYKKTIVRLARHLDQTTSPEARATIVWLVAEFAVGDPDIKIAPDVLRILIKGFADESEQVKQQILLLAAKVYLQHLQDDSRASPATDQAPPDDQVPTPNDPTSSSSTSAPTDPIPILWRYTLLLTRYDTSYDLRDRARLFKALLANPDATQLARLLLLAPKPVPHTPSPSESRKGLRLGSTSLILAGSSEDGVHGVTLPGYEPVPDWVTEGDEPDPKLRDTDAIVGGGGDGTERTNQISASAKLDELVKQRGLSETVVGSKVGPNRGKEVSLNDWLDEEEESGSETSSGDVESEDEEEEEEGSSEEGEEQEGTGLMS